MELFSALELYAATLDEDALAIESIAAIAEFRRAAESRGAKAAREEAATIVRTWMVREAGVGKMVAGGKETWCCPGCDRDADGAHQGYCIYEKLERALSAFGADAQRPPGSPSVPASQPKDQANQGAPTREASAPPDPLTGHERDVMEAWRTYFCELCDVLFPESVGQPALIGWKHVIAKARELVSGQPRAAPSDSAPATPGLGTQEGLDGAPSARSPQCPSPLCACCDELPQVLDYWRAGEQRIEDLEVALRVFIEWDDVDKSDPDAETWPLLHKALAQARALAGTSDKPAAGPSSPSSASLESGGGTLETNKAEGGVSPRTPEAD